MMPMLKLAIPALMLLAGGAAYAQDPDRQWSACDNLSGEETPAAVIAGCTAIIDGRQVPPRTLSAALRNRGTAFRVAGDPARATEDFTMALSLSPQDADLFYVRGNTYAAQRDYARAIADYDQAIRLDPGSPQAFNNRGGAYHSQKNHARAIADFDQALALEPDYPAALSNRCAARVALRQELEKALADCSRSLTLRPGHMPTLDTRALASLLKGDHSAALTDYEAILSLDDKEYGALYGRGLARLRLGRTEPGRADIAAASAGDPTVPPYYESLGLRP